MLRSITVSSPVEAFRRMMMLWRFSAMVFMAAARSPTSPQALMVSRSSSEPPATCLAKSTQRLIGRVTDSVMKVESTVIRVIRIKITAAVVMVLLRVMAVICFSV
jgi:hypothetical protein